jgi:hypothetical protein
MAKKRRRTFGTVVRLPSGRYRARYFYQGVFHNAPETYRTVADANAWLTVEESSIQQGTWVPVAGSAHEGGGAGGQMAGLEPVDVGQLPSRDASTVKHYTKPVIGNLKVTCPTEVTLQELVDNWTAAHHLGPSHRPSNGLNPACRLPVRRQ